LEHRSATSARTALAALLSSALALCVLASCGCEDPPAEPEADATAASAAALEHIDSGAAERGSAAPSGPPKRIFAKRFVVNVRARPDPEALRIGYLRAGAVLQATTAEPISSAGCRGGWFELTTGGFVCNGTDVIAFDGRRLPERRPAQPDLDAPLPYRFSRTRRDGTPMYRRLPTDDEAAVYEGYRIPGVRVELLPDGGIRRTLEPPSALSEEAGEVGSGEAAPESAPAQADAYAATHGPSVGAVADRDLEAAEPVVPTLNSLQGEPGSVVMRRLVKGFIVSLDRDIRIGARRYWRTLSNGFVPYASQVEVQGPSFHGFELAPPRTSEAAGAGPGGPEAREARHDDGRWRLPIGFVLSSKTVSYERGRDGRLRRGRAPGYHHAFQIVGEETHRGRAYLVAHDGLLFERRDVRIVDAHDPPPGVGEGDRWIDIDLTHQSLVAYEGRTPVYATLVSTGRVRDPGNPLRDMRTPSGLFRITSKHISHTMDGDHAVDGPYSIEDVPYVMYFQLAYALHSAFWHDSFGRPRSHGCVNLAPLDARWIFRWTTPRVPDGWHGAYPTGETPGTWVWIHGETPEG
jgi:hypothetical protein